MAELNQPLIEEIEEEFKEEETDFCEICYDDHPKSMFFKIPECNHGFCEASLKDFFTFQITQSGQGHKVSCPQKDCGQVVLDDFIKRFVDNNTFQKFLEFKNNHEIAMSGDKKFCPRPNCEGVVQA